MDTIRWERINNFKLSFSLSWKCAH